MPKAIRTRLEQIRQAKRIHGGTAKMCAAALGVKLARLPIPARFREKLYRKVYGQKYPSIDEEQLDRPLREYRSLNELFTRGVRPDFRPLPEQASTIICPCDSTVQEVGTLHAEKMVTIKGIEYSLDELLPGIATSTYADGPYAIFFLSPADCHRVFCPQDAMLREVLHVPGRRLLVHPPYQRAAFPVFSLNERVIARFRSELGDFVLVMVAGWGVGNITFPFHLPLRHKRTRLTRAVLPKPKPFRRGDWLATFELGSTVMLIGEQAAHWQSALANDQTVRYGEPAFSPRLPTTQQEANQ